MRVKRITEIVVLTVSVIIGICLTGFPEKMARYSDCVVSRERAEDIAAGRQESAGLVERLSFGVETLFYDAAEEMFYYSLIEGNKDAYDPRIRIESSEKDVRLAFLEKEITAEGIGSNETITFLAYTDTSYHTYHLKCTTLPLMDIECRGEIPDETIPMEITLFDNGINAAGRLVCSEGEIRLRGGTTRAYPKKGFRFSLRTESTGGNIRPNHVSLLGMRQDDDWLLYAAYNDQEKIRNVFTSNLWKESCAADNALGIDFGMEYKYLELFINGRYWGLYALGYPIDEKQVCINEDSDESVLYKHGLLGKEGNESLQFTKEGDIFGRLDDSPDEELQKQAFLQRYYHDLYLHAQDDKRLYSGIDIENAIDFYLFINLVQGKDNVSMEKNFFILLRNGKEGAKALYAPWDLDLTWGNQFIGVGEKNYTYPYACTEDSNCIIESGYISQLLFNDDAYIWGKMFEKYRLLREDKWSEEKIDALLDGYEADIFASGAFRRDMERWPDGTYGNAADGLDIFRAYVRNRLREADLYYERLENTYRETSNLFIRRSTQYKDFLERDFLIEINDHERLSDPAYSDFLEYMGVDVSAVSEDVHFILANPVLEECEYLPALYEEAGPRETCIGRLSFTELREGVYNVKVDGVEHYDTTIFSEPAIGMAVIKGTTICRFDFTDGYDMDNKWKSSFETFSHYIKALSGTDYRAVVEINNPALWQEDRYTALFECLGLPKESFHKDTDFIVWNGPQKSAFAVDGFHASGSSCDSPLGALSVFANELGEYGVYLDGRECYVCSPEENVNVDIRVVLLDPKSYDRADMITFSDDLR